MALDGNVKLPGIGEVKKKTAVVGGAAIAGLIIVVALRQRSKAANSTANPAQTAGGIAGLVTDPAGNQCAAVDVNSGYCPGSPEDASYQNQLAQSGGVLGVGGSPYSGGGGVGVSNPYVTDPAGNVCAALGANGYCPGFGPTGAVPGGTGGITTNTEWLQAAEQALGNTSAVDSALIKVLGGVSVTADQKAIFDEALGVLGQAPPQGYPPINLISTSAHPGGGKKRVPNVVGSRGDIARQLLRADGFKAEGTYGPGGQTVTHQSPGGGSMADVGSAVHLTYRNTR